MDILVSLLILPVLIIIIPIVGIFIKLEDRGTIFYKAARLGKDSKPFKMYKFRSMKINAPDIRNKDGSTFNSKDDPRMTKIGKFIRKTSIDELPQLLNVLIGDMSLVGPRPTLLDQISMYEGNEIRRLEVLPGITGYSQCYFRNSIPVKERFKNDIFYIDHISFLLDVKIVLKTVVILFQQKNVFSNDKKMEKRNCVKLCFFSDIHGNCYALDEFISNSSKLHIDQYIFCGDIFGYYYEQDAVISNLSRMKNLYCIKGNHDQNYLNVCLGLEDENRFINKYGNSYKNISEKISAENRAFVENMQDSLELNCEGKRIGIFHGSPMDTLNERVYPDTEILESNKYKKYDYVILGHTHYRMVRYVGSTTVINPGSIGQPRDKNGFSFATLTIPDGEIKFHEIKFDRSKLVKDIEKNDKGNKKFIDILFKNEVN